MKPCSISPPFPRILQVCLMLHREIRIIRGRINFERGAKKKRRGEGIELV